MDLFSTGDKNFFDGLVMPEATQTDSVAFNAAQQISSQIQKIMDKNTTTSEHVINYHRIFDTIFRASESVRTSQKQNFDTQIAEIQEIHRQELIDAFTRTYTKALTVSFVPEDAAVEETMEDYILMAMETGKPLNEILPVTMLASLLAADDCECSGAV